MAYFELVSPRDMLAKAKREHDRLIQALNIDHVFNFFVTAYHICDYIEKTNAVHQKYLDAFRSDLVIKTCRDLCDKGKHMRLTKEGRVDPITTVWSGAVGGAPLGSLPINSNDRWMLILPDGSEVDVELLATQVLEKWTAFFEEHGL